jgi:methylmalonyl-CoA mutase cobalamin-binding subunit
MLSTSITLGTPEELIRQAKADGGAALGISSLDTRIT